MPNSGRVLAGDIDIPKNLAEKYRDKNVAVIGGLGFVGNWLRVALTMCGANVLVIDNLSRGFSFGQYMATGGTKIGIDVSKEIDYLSSHLKPADYVFNLAASVDGVLYNENHHAEMYKENIDVLMGPVLAASKAGVPAFLQTSSVCVYAPEHNAPSIERYGLTGEPHGANAGYAEAKRDGERFAKWSKLEHVVIARPSNVAGYGDYYDDKAHVIPAFIRRAFELKKSGGKSFVVYGDPYATREFIHPADVATGMMFALSGGDNRGAYNIGTF
jgi:nucleoside-diphosphate-sugar epimerase